MTAIVPDDDVTEITPNGKSVPVAPATPSPKITAQGLHPAIVPDEDVVETTPTASTTVTPTSAAPIAAKQSFGNWLVQGSPEDQKAFVNNANSVADSEKNMPAVDRIKSGFSEISAVPGALERGLESPFPVDRINAAGASYLGVGAYPNVPNTYNDQLKAFQDDRAAAAAKLSPDAEQTLETIGSMATPMGFLGKIAKSGKPLLDRALTGAAVGGGIGAAQKISANKDWTNIGQLTTDAGEGLATGAAVGLGVPVVANAVGSLAKKALNTFSNYHIPVAGPTGPVMQPEAEQKLLEGISQSDQANITQKMQKYGADATLADVDPAMLNKAQGVAGAAITKDPESFGNMSRFYENREANTNARVQSDIDQHLGPMNDTQNSAARSFIEEQKDIGENTFRPLLANNTNPVDVAPVVQKIDDNLSKTVPTTPEGQALTRFRAMLVKSPAQSTEATTILHRAGGDPNGAIVRREYVPPTSTPETYITDANQLHSAKQALGNMTTFGAPEINIPNGAEARKYGSLNSLYNDMNGALDVVPGYRDAQDKLSGLFKSREALNYGSDIIKNPENADDFKYKFGNMEQPQQEAVKVGMRFQLGNQLSNSKAKDSQVLDRVLRGPDGNTGLNIGHAFGQDAQDGLNNTVDREKAFANTKQKVIDGAQTQPRQQATQNIMDGAPQEKPVIGPNVIDTHSSFFGSTGAGAANVVNRVGGVLKSAPQVGQYFNHLSSAFTTPGLQGQQLLAQALRSGAAQTKNQNISQGMIRALTLGAGSVPTYLLENQQHQPPERK